MWPSSVDPIYWSRGRNSTGSGNQTCVTCFKHQKQKTDFFFNNNKKIIICESFTYCFIYLQPSLTAMKTNTLFWFPYTLFHHTAFQYEIGLNFLNCKGLRVNSVLIRYFVRGAAVPQSYWKRIYTYIGQSQLHSWFNLLQLVKIVLVRLLWWNGGSVKASQWNYKGGDNSLFVLHQGPRAQLNWYYHLSRTIIKYGPILTNITG